VYEWRLRLGSSHSRWEEGSIPVLKAHAAHVHGEVWRRVHTYNICAAIRSFTFSMGDGLGGVRQEA
jgi:hypothetical protein